MLRLLVIGGWYLYAAWQLWNSWLAVINIATTILARGWQLNLLTTLTGRVCWQSVCTAILLVRLRLADIRDRHELDLVEHVALDDHGHMRLYIWELDEHLQVLFVDRTSYLIIWTDLFLKFDQVLFVLAPRIVIDETANTALHIIHHLSVKLIIIVLEWGSTDAWGHSISPCLPHYYYTFQ